jgi:hypothetical protein
MDTKQMQAHSNSYEKGKTPPTISFNFLNPFFTFDMSDPRMETFSCLVGAVCLYANFCTDRELWDLANNQEIKRNVRGLKVFRYEIERILEELLPNYDTKKKEDSFLRLCRKSPRALVERVELMVKAMGLDSSYKGRPGKKEEDVKKFFERVSKKPYPKNIKIYWRSKSTIVLSIIAYGTVCDYGKLEDIYYSVPKSKRRKIAESI